LKPEKVQDRLNEQMNSVSKATATRHLQELGSLNIIQSNKGKGAGHVIHWAREGRIIGSIYPNSSY
jgi:DNA-binding IscR family transcriptional regulator